jgi:hypothetical protein
MRFRSKQRLETTFSYNIFLKLNEEKENECYINVFIIKYKFTK